MRYDVNRALRKTRAVAALKVRFGPEADVGKLRSSVVQ